MKIDLSQIDDFEDFRAIPPGEYHCRAVEVRESDSPAGHIRWGIRWEVVSGEFQGRTACWDSLHWGTTKDSKKILQHSNWPDLRALETTIPLLKRIYRH